MLSYFFKGMGEIQFKKVAQEYSINHINTIIKSKVIERIIWHKEQGHMIVVVSASIECWLKPWCEQMDLGLIATKLEIRNTTIMGKLLTKNCYGIEKVNRINEIYTLADYEYIYAYRDSRGDKEMLDLANEKNYKFFSF
ncbi:HAD-IB family phosphatase [Sulfurimonas aquatica]|uniref:HAD-IB family phosphatase n=1 Tax=Sulfurimonas aquatica TaxID=2672570 RepID=A0A975AYP4_9BACT|nr:HAD-IB family phosphatase [Sulfurimonas aquatica]QSZ40920.1 HAD-IB family phosphatase [Sulfurimonas aquatica]